MDKEYYSVRIEVSIYLDYLEEIDNLDKLDVEYNLFKVIDYIKYKGWLDRMYQEFMEDRFTNKELVNKYLKGE